MEISYLDELADGVFGFLYFKLVHGYSRTEEEESIKRQVELLTVDEKLYVSQRVQDAFSELRKDNKNEKTF